MRTHYFFGLILCIGLLAPASAARADLKFFPDPAYKRLNADDPPPMSEMVDLANQGDTRAMFILGDMSEKGKGGLEKDVKQARQWFGESAMHGYSQSFIRLAAMAKRDNNPKEAWQWYTLAISSFDSGDTQDYCIRARKELVEKAGLSTDDIDQARKAVDDWKDARDKQLRAEKAAAEKAAADDAEKERLQKEQDENNAKLAAQAQQQDKKQDNNPGQQEQESDNEQ